MWEVLKFRSQFKSGTTKTPSSPENSLNIWTLREDYWETLGIYLNAYAKNQKDLRMQI